ncbi:MAG TPA: tail fiber protein [Gemmataceae bacterium]|nr:tail fiber protein [Gemmataceae bacterium]
MDPYLGEIKMFGGNFAIMGWAFCDGSLLSISQNDALFALFGTTYGGDGQTTFALPDLRGRVPVHISSTFPQGQVAGTESVTLTQAQIPAHNHLVMTNAATTTANPSNAVLGGTTGAANAMYTKDTSSPATLTPAEVGLSGGNLPHDNLMPFQCVTFLVALQGIFPSRN